VEDVVEVSAGAGQPVELSHYNGVAREEATLELFKLSSAVGRFA
jgi:hypothetical protein